MAKRAGHLEPPAPVRRAKRDSPSSSSSFWIDYGKAASDPKFLPNLSAVAVAGNYLWTASDEMRTVECLVSDGRGYRLHRQYSLNDLFPGLPGAARNREADIEALDVSGGTLWICGSHSLTRRLRNKPTSDRVEALINKRPSRRLLGAVPLSKDGGEISGPAVALPFKGEGSLRALLAANSYLAPFKNLPSKENGIDIEGFVAFRDKNYVGLRGPVVQNIAVIAEIGIGAGLKLNERSLFLHFVDLAGLGVRDLTRWQDRILILAGPVSSANGPFGLFSWKPQRTGKIQVPQKKQPLASGLDHPEGICPLRRGREQGLMVLYDTTNPQRTKGTRYRADWMKIR